MNYEKNIIFSILVLAFISGCNSVKETIKDATLAETKWKLVELNGKPVENSSLSGNEIYIKMTSADGRVQGFAGCNNFTGSYTVQSGNRISFSKMAVTQKACPDMTTEDMLLKALNTTDNFNLSERKLTLNRARMAPLARFEAAGLFK